MSTATATKPKATTIEATTAPATTAPGADMAAMSEAELAAHIRELTAQQKALAARAAQIETEKAAELAGRVNGAHLIALSREKSDLPTQIQALEVSLAAARYRAAQLRLSAAEQARDAASEPLAQAAAQLKIAQDKHQRALWDSQDANVLWREETKTVGDLRRAWQAAAHRLEQIVK